MSTRWPSLNSVVQNVLRRVRVSRQLSSGKRYLDSGCWAAVSGQPGQVLSAWLRVPSRRCYRRRSTGHHSDGHVDLSRPLASPPSAHTHSKWLVIYYNTETIRERGGARRWRHISTWTKVRRKASDCSRARTHTKVCQELNDHGSRLRLYVWHALASFDV